MSACELTNPKAISIKRVRDFPRSCALLATATVIEPFPGKRGKKDLIRRLQAQQRPIIFICDEVDQAVRALPHIANALMQFRQQRFTTQFLHLVGDYHSFEAAGARHLTAARAAHEQIPLPGRESIAGVEHQSRRRDRRESTA
jgi:hypothetical protein